MNGLLGYEATQGDDSPDVDIDSTVNQDVHDALVAEAVGTFHNMQLILDKRNARRHAEGKSLVKYDPYCGQGKIIALLCEKDGVTQADMARELDVKPQTLSIAIKKLESKGMVRRVHSPSDARVLLVFVTERGRELKQSLDRVEPYSGSMFESLNDEELRQIINISAKLSIHLENELAANAAIDQLVG